MSVQKPALRYGTSHAAGPTVLCKYLTSFLVVVVVLLFFYLLSLWLILNIGSYMECQYYYYYYYHYY